MPRPQKHTDDREIRFRRVTDPAKIAELESGEKIKAYRAMQVIDGKLYPPMWARIDGTGMREDSRLGVWEESEEDPSQIKKYNADGVGYVKLLSGSKTPSGRENQTDNVAYNPYFHTSLSPLNDQFSSAWVRPNLVTVECEIPKSELTSGYRAEHAKNAVGQTEWHTGPVAAQLKKQGKPRIVILSRWAKPVRVVPEIEVAKSIAATLKGTGIGVPENTVTPRLRDALKREGVTISKPKGSQIKKEADYREAVEKGLYVDNTLRYRRASSEEREIEERAKQDGTYLKAPNGEPSHLTPEQWTQVRTKAFKEFYGDWEKDPENASKVLNENGEPLVVYHAGAKGIEAFSHDFIRSGIGRQLWGKGFYFGVRESMLEWARQYKRKTGREAEVYPVYLNIRNPKYGALRVADGRNTDPHDGAIINGQRTSNGMTHDMFIATKPEQIKSATDNNGLFSRNNPDIRFRFIGEKGARAADLAEEGTARLDNLRTAREMEKAGKDAKAVKLATGWERGADQKWRYEQGDFKSIDFEKWEQDYVNGNEDTYKYLDEVITEGGESLFAAYPDLRDIEVTIRPSDDLCDTLGCYDNDKKEIALNTEIYSNAHVSSALIHEVQHAIQYIEGFTNGTNDNGAALGKHRVLNAIDDVTNGCVLDLYGNINGKDPGYATEKEMLQAIDYAVQEYGADRDDIESVLAEYGFDSIEDMAQKLGSKDDVYHRTAGEVEARNVESRVPMTPEQRRASLASETEDVSRADQLFISAATLAESRREGKGKNFLTEAAAESARLGTPLHIYYDIEQLPKEVREKEKDGILGGVVKAWYDPVTGDAGLYAPNCTDKADAMVSVWHEVVAHKGMRGLLGEAEYDKLCERVCDDLPDKERDKQLMYTYFDMSKERLAAIFGKQPPASYGKLTPKQKAWFAAAPSVRRIVGDEYIAKCAESGEFANPTVWQRIKEAVLAFARRFGLANKVTDTDIRAMLSKSYEQLQNMKNNPKEGKEEKTAPRDNIRFRATDEAQTYLNGQPKYEFHFNKANRLDGTQRRFLPDGSVTQEYNYRDGKQHGTQKDYYIDGTMKEASEYRDGKLHGSQRTFYPDGRPQAERNYADGLLHGQQKTWHPNGHLATVRNYDHGKLEGAQYEYHENGYLKTMSSYHADRLHGPCALYDACGTKISDGEYRDGKRDGIQHEMRIVDDDYDTQFYVEGRKVTAEEYAALRLPPQNAITSRQVWAEHSEYERCLRSVGDSKQIVLMRFGDEIRAYGETATRTARALGAETTLQDVGGRQPVLVFSAPASELQSVIGRLAMQGESVVLNHSSIATPTASDEHEEHTQEREREVDESQSRGRGR